VADAWDSGHAYEQYIGRWSRRVATEFLRWLAPPPGLAWADVGCGTGKLASTIVDACNGEGSGTHDPAIVTDARGSPDRMRLTESPPNYLPLWPAAPVAERLTFDNWRSL
jgi:hypothetical protein